MREAILVIGAQSHSVRMGARMGARMVCPVASVVCPVASLAASSLLVWWAGHLTIANSVGSCMA